MTILHNGIHYISCYVEIGCKQKLIFATGSVAMKELGTKFILLKELKKAKIITYHPSTKQKTAFFN